MPAAVSWFVRLRQLAGLLAAVLILSIWLAVQHETGEIHARYETAQRIRAENMARVYGEVVRSALQELDVAMLVLRDLFQRGDTGLFKRTTALLCQGPLAGLVIQVAVIGRDGLLRYSSLGTPARPVDLSDRPHFLVHLGEDRDRPYIGAPVLGRVSQQWTVQVSRRLDDAQGRFAGVLVFSVPARALAQVGHDIDLGEDHVLTLIKPDLTVVSRYPQVDAYLGVRLPESVRPFISPPYQAHLRPSTLDGRERMIAYQPLAEQDLLAGVSLSMAGVRAGIGKESRQYGYLAAAATALVLLIWWVSCRYLQQSERVERLRQHERERLEETLNLAGFGSWEEDLVQPCLRWSPSAQDVFGFARDEPPPSVAAFMTRIHADDRKRVEAAVARCRQEGQPFEVEYRMLPAEGRSEKILFARGVREVDAAGQPILIRGVVFDVTESRRMAAALHEAEQRWQWAVTASRDGVWDIDLRTRAAWYSPRWKAMLGYSPEDIEDDCETWTRLMHPDDLPEAMRLAQSCRERRPPFYEAEFRMRTKEGGWRWVLSRGQAVEWDEAGLPCRFMGMQTDISERKAVELALVQERQRLAEVQALAQMGGWEWDIASGGLWWSDETFRIFGLEPGECSPTLEAFTLRIHPDDRGRVQAAIDESLRDRRPYQVDHRIQRPDGGIRYVQERGNPLFDAQGTPVRMLGTVQDITARKRVEDAMAESEARYRSLVAAMAEGVVVQDARGVITFCNDAACQILGVSRAQMLGLDSLDSCWQAIREDGTSLSGAEHPATLARATGQPVDRVVMGVLHPDGSRVWLNVNARPLLLPGDEQAHGVVITFADITRAKAAQLNGQLAEAVVNSTSQPIVVTDAEGCIVQANPAFCRLAGYALQDIVGRPVGEVMNPGHPNPALHRDLWQSLRQEGNWEGEVWNRRRTGEMVPQWLAITAIRNPGGGVERYVGVYMDITERKRREERMWKAANYDYLTGLPNRLLFHDRLKAGLARARRLGTRLAVLFIDLDRFKQINDSYGHQAGDRVLQAIARRMSRCVREDDTLARIAGDEFMVLLQNLKEPEQVEQIAAKLLAAALQPIDLGEDEVEVSCSIGYTVFPDDDPEGTQLVEQADQAMYRIKEQGRNGIARFIPGEAQS